MMATRSRSFSSLFWLMLTFSVLPVKDAQAFCGLFVQSSDAEWKAAQVWNDSHHQGSTASRVNAKLYNNATQVVLMREGTKTILSMQNDYEGPLEDFAMVVPVPVVLKKDDVKVLWSKAFDNLDELTSPRLVDYFEMDPCAVHKGAESRVKFYHFEDTRGSASNTTNVQIKVQFAVGEYEIAILSAKDSVGLEAWLKANKYKLPDGASPILQSYIQQGMYFFVAKVNIKKVKFKEVGGKKIAVLSPLRFHYDADYLTLPVRLGLLNANGPQDLIIYTIANTRYELANYKNITIPTNLIVDPSVRERFGEFYNALFDYTIKTYPNSVVTEYVQSSMTCHNCPGVLKTGHYFRYFGADVAPSILRAPVLTRLHLRYDATMLKDDLVFKRATPIMGGLGAPAQGSGNLVEQGAQEAERNLFQARYVILNPLTQLTCKAPKTGNWSAVRSEAATPVTVNAQSLAYTKSDKLKLHKLIKNLDAPGLNMLKHEASTEAAR